MIPTGQGGQGGHQKQRDVGRTKAMKLRANCESFTSLCPPVETFTAREVNLSHSASLLYQNSALERFRSCLQWYYKESDPSWKGQTDHILPLSFCVIDCLILLENNWKLALLSRRGDSLRQHHPEALTRLALVSGFLGQFCLDSVSAHPRFHQGQTL